MSAAPPDPDGYQPSTWAAADPHRRATIVENAAVTYAELEERSRRLSQALRAAGLEIGDHVAVLVDNHPRAHEVLWGAHRAGLYYTPIGTKLTGAEAAFVVGDCGARALLTTGACRQLAEDLVGETAGVRHRWALDGPVAGHEDYDAVVGAHPADRLTDEQEGMAMIYSSGTTGRPKGVVRPLLGMPLGRNRGVYDAFTRYPIGSGSVFLLPAPIYHAAPLAW
jgi:fatty-acyl-CoA synthase